MTATAYAACGMILAGCATWAFHGPLAAAILRARWAWHCHGEPVRPDGDRLSFDEAKTLGGIVSGRKRTARPERTRT